METKVYKRATWKFVVFSIGCLLFVVVGIMGLIMMRYTSQKIISVLFGGLVGGGLFYILWLKYNANSFIEMAEDYVYFKNYIGEPKKVMYDDVEEFVYKKISSEDSTIIINYKEDTKQQKIDDAINKLKKIGYDTQKAEEMVLEKGFIFDSAPTIEVDTYVLSVSAGKVCKELNKYLKEYKEKHQAEELCEVRS